MAISKITIFQQPLVERAKQGFHSRTEWFHNRNEVLNYKSNFIGEKAAEEAFELTNAPKEYLSEEAQKFQESLKYKGPSLSVGDIVRIEPTIRDGKNFPEYFMCKSFGWEKYTGDSIQLLRHLVF